MYSSGTVVFKRFEWVGTVSGLQGHYHFPQKNKTECCRKHWLFSKGAAQIHFINGIGDIWDLGNSSSDYVDIASFSSIMWALFQQIETDLRSTVSQDRFTNLAILSIENEVASSIDFSDAIKDLVAIKSRKVQFSIFDWCQKENCFVTKWKKFLEIIVIFF
jgi:hypothetical protein